MATILLLTVNTWKVRISTTHVVRHHTVVSGSAVNKLTFYRPRLRFVSYTTTSLLSLVYWGNYHAIFVSGDIVYFINITSDKLFHKIVNLKFKCPTAYVTDIKWMETIRTKNSCFCKPRGTFDYINVGVLIAYY